MRERKPSSSEIKGVDPKAIHSITQSSWAAQIIWGGPTRGVKKFIDKIGKLSLADKRFAVFDTYGVGNFEKATKKMEQRMREKAPAMKPLATVLSIRVDRMKGPITEGELSKAEGLECR